jgi:hypothetical protein
LECLPGYLQLRGEDLIGIMLYPAGLGEILGKFLLSHAADIARFIKEDAAVTGGAGIQGHDIFTHR